MMDNMININISKVNYLKEVFKMIDKGNKNFWDRFAKLYAVSYTHLTLPTKA